MDGRRKNTKRPTRTATTRAAVQPIDRTVLVPVGNTPHLRKTYTDSVGISVTIGTDGSRAVCHFPALTADPDNPMDACRAIRMFVDRCEVLEQSILSAHGETDHADDDGENCADLADFIREDCRIGEDLSIQPSELYDVYTCWCNERRCQPVSINRFGSFILNEVPGTVRKVRMRTGNTIVSVYRGITLQEHARPQVPEKSVGQQQRERIAWAITTGIASPERIAERLWVPFCEVAEIARECQGTPARKERA